MFLNIKFFFSKYLHISKKSCNFVVQSYKNGMRATFIIVTSKKCYKFERLKR